MSFDPREAKLNRPLQPLPEDIYTRLQAENVAADYSARPAYQQNDYLMWIASAKRPATREKRIAQMIDELRRGGVYMGMKHTPSKR